MRRRKTKKPENQSATPPRTGIYSPGSVRVRLLAIALLPTLVLLPLLLGIAILQWNEKFNATLSSKVSGDLIIAQQYMARILENTGERLDGIGRSADFRDIIAAGGNDALPQMLEASRTALGLDFLYVSDGQGGVLASAPPFAAPKIRQAWPVVEGALGGKAATAIDIFSSRELADLSPAIAARARLELVPTPNAAPTDRTVETRGMMVHSAAPVRIGGERRGALVGGLLLNQNLPFIDAINALVYNAATLPRGSVGTATLFLDDVRVSTNVRLFEGRRALGTRVSQAVRNAVLGEGLVWLASAFVVNDWYMSAYEPITDSFGNRVGMLYVGFLEAPFTQTKYTTLLIIGAAFLAVTAVSVPIFLHWAGAIFRPLERVTETIAKVEHGDLGARTGLTARHDEIGRVGHHLDGLLTLLQEREQQLIEWNNELNRRVDERTEELQRANRQLEATTKQLIVSEKLAAIGEITAGVAHEINNPIAVMQGNLDVLRSLVGSNVAPTEFRLLDEQIHRISQIVTKLLQFARPEEFAGYVERHAPGSVIADCLPLVRHLLSRAAIDVRLQDQASRQVLMNRTELQQVIINLIVNAIHAMPNGGRLDLIATDFDQGDRPGITIVVIDTGIGMPPEIMARIFDPFFTTKRREGTGLGLSISQTMVTRQGGSIAVESVEGQGTTFTIWLPEAA